MIVIKNNFNTDEYGTTVSVDDFLHFGLIENNEKLDDCCKDFYNITESITDIIKKYPNLIISGLLTGQSTKLFGTKPIEYRLSSIHELIQLLDNLSGNYCVLHGISIDSREKGYTDGDLIEVELYLLNEYCDAKLNSFLRTHTINSLLKTL